MEKPSRRLLQHNRDILTWLDRYGAKQVDRAEALRVLEGIQAGVTVDDVSYLSSPIPVPVFGFYVNTAAPGAGFFHTCDLYIRARRGAYLISPMMLNANVVLFTDQPAGGALGLPVALAPQIAGMGERANLTTQVETGRLNVTQPGMSLAWYATSIPPMWFPAGTHLRFGHQNANVAADYTFCIQEVP